MEAGSKVSDSEVLKIIMEKKGVNNKELSELLGVSRPTVDNWLYGKNKDGQFLDKRTIFMICSLFKLPAEVFNRSESFFHLPGGSNITGNSVELIAPSYEQDPGPRGYEFIDRYFQAFDEYVIEELSESLHVLLYLPGSLGLEQKLGGGIIEKYSEKNKAYFQKLEEKLLSIKKQKVFPFKYKRLIQLPYNPKFIKDDSLEELSSLIEKIDLEIKELINTIYNRDDFQNRFEVFKASHFYTKPVGDDNSPGSVKLDYLNKFEEAGVSDVLLGRWEELKQKEQKGGLPNFEEPFFKKVSRMVELMLLEEYEHTLNCFRAVPEFFSLYLLENPSRLYSFWLVDKKHTLTEYIRISKDGYALIDRLFINRRMFKGDMGDVLAQSNFRDFSFLTRHEMPGQYKEKQKKRVVRETMEVATKMVWDYLTFTIYMLTQRYEYLCHERSLLRKRKEGEGQDHLLKLHKVKEKIKDLRLEYIYRLKCFKPKVDFTLDTFRSSR